MQFHVTLWSYQPNQINFVAYVFLHPSLKKVMPIRNAFVPSKLLFEVIKRKINESKLDNEHRINIVP